MIPEFGTAAEFGADREVHRALILPDEPGIGGDIEKALIVATVARLRAADRLVQTLSVGRAAGLLVADAPDTASLAAIREAAVRHHLPLLTSTRSLAVWESELARTVVDLCVASARRHSARLGALLEHLRPSSDTASDISGLLARELDADVVVRSADGILAAAPPAAQLSLASVTHQPDVPHQTTPGGMFARTVPLSPDETLIVATKEPQSRADRAVVTHAATALAFALAPRPHPADAPFAAAVRGIRLSAFQLLMTGHAIHAQRVMAGVTPGLLDTETARVFIVDCARADRDTVMAEVERRLDSRTLPVRCPAFHEHIIIVVPRHHEHDAERELCRLREAFASADVSLGGSPPHPLEGVGDAYAEAADALTRAAHHPERTVVASSRTPGLVDILPAAPARAWADRFLHPILSMPREGRQILEATAMALEFRTSAAARVIGVHRNTVARRVNQVCGGVGINPERTLDRIALSLAIQIVHTHHASSTDDADASLHNLLTHTRVRAWAETALRPLADDRRDLVRTLRAWVLSEFSADTAAARLGIATKTVRSHIRAAEPLLRKDLITGIPQDGEDTEQRLSGIRPLTVALYATTPPGGVHPAFPTVTWPRTTRQPVPRGAETGTDLR
ncbi:helix-turn-helix domain-containing protein [Yinghuangia sp. ASG 101]|uniref:helix-turn-helix domain-containing protein n=1 Tax=Yinghuangia sp. ASG 101 TaxID=2896848 RepID=UPI001E37DEE2|nr:helix-turn-helix domain-containing protein [Yinghuangia sp. ASG 101]UGQ15662.1 helix-turn-helix domain-containing protein [Yinghuangia sp. ASG 101]